MKAGSKKNKSPLKDIQAASMAMEQEYKAVKRLKRLSIGNSLNFDPDLPLTDVDTEDEIIDFDLSHEQSSNEDVGSSTNSKEGSGDFGNHHDDDEDDDEYLDYGQYNNIDFLDIDPDSSLTDSDIWVPANAHPKLAPENFRKHVEQQVLEIQNKSKLQRSGSVKSSLGKERKLGDFSDNGISSQIATKDTTDDENEMSSSPDTEHYVDAVDGIQSHQGPEEWQRKPSLKELTEQLENLSQKAGLDKDDAASLARTLSTKSIGITRVEKEVFAERSIDQIPRRGHHNLQKQDYQSRASLVLTDDSVSHNNNDIQTKLEHNPKLEQQQQHHHHVYKDIQNIQKKSFNQQTADGPPLRASNSKPRGKLPDVPSRTSPTSKNNVHSVPHRSMNQRLPNSSFQQQRSFDPRFQQKILYHNQQQQLYQQQQLQHYHHQNRQQLPVQKLNIQQQQQQQQLQFRRHYPRNGYQVQKTPINEGYNHHNKKQNYRQQHYTDQQTGKQIPLIKKQLDHHSSRQQQFPQQYPNYGHVQQHKPPQSQRLNKLQQNIPPIQTSQHRQHHNSTMQTSPVTPQSNIDLGKFGKSSLNSSENLVQVHQSPVERSPVEQLCTKESPVKEKILTELKNATNTPTQNQTALKKIASAPKNDAEQATSKLEVLDSQAPKVEKLIINKTRDSKSETANKKGKDEKTKQKDRKTSFTSFFKFKSRSASSASHSELNVGQSSSTDSTSTKKRLVESNKVDNVSKDFSNSRQTTSPSTSASTNNFKSLFTKNKSKEKANEKDDEITGPSIASFGLRKKSSVENLLRLKKKSETTMSHETGPKIAEFEQQADLTKSHVSIDNKAIAKENMISDAEVKQSHDFKQETTTLSHSNLPPPKDDNLQANLLSSSKLSLPLQNDGDQPKATIFNGTIEHKLENEEVEKNKPNRESNEIQNGIQNIEHARDDIKVDNRFSSADTGKSALNLPGANLEPKDLPESNEAEIKEDEILDVENQSDEAQTDAIDISINEEKFNDSINEIIITNTTVNSDMTEGNDTEDGIEMAKDQEKKDNNSEEESEGEPSKALLKQALTETIQSQKITGPNQPLEMRDSAFGFPLPPVSQSTIFMIDHRLPVHVERAIYRLSHLKLADAKRPLRQQVLLSNFMYSYLNLINHTLWLQSQQELDPNENEVI